MPRIEHVEPVALDRDASRLAEHGVPETRTPFAQQVPGRIETHDGVTLGVRDDQVAAWLDGHKGELAALRRPAADPQQHTGGDGVDAVPVESGWGLNAASTQTQALAVRSRSIPVTQWPALRTGLADQPAADCAPARNRIIRPVNDEFRQSGQVSEFAPPTIKHRRSFGAAEWGLVRGVALGLVLGSLLPGRAFSTSGSARRAGGWP